MDEGNFISSLSSLFHVSLRFEIRLCCRFRISCGCGGLGLALLRFRQVAILTCGCGGGSGPLRLFPSSAALLSSSHARSLGHLPFFPRDDDVCTPHAASVQSSAGHSDSPVSSFAAFALSNGRACRRERCMRQWIGDGHEGQESSPRKDGQTG